MIDWDADIVSNREGYRGINVVAYGGGINSTAMIIGMYRHDIPIDLILFADTGAEKPCTYEFIAVFNEWLKSKGLPKIKTLKYMDRNGNRLTLECECLKSKTLPALAYGYKKCSLKHKRSVQDKYCNRNSRCRKEWAHGKKVNKFIGYDAGESYRVEGAIEGDATDKKYNYCYPLYELWGWGREKCIKAIKEEGLPIPPKSSCFFCPSMKKEEIIDLRGEYPDLFQRAIEIESNAMPGLKTVKGLGRAYSWKALIEAFDAQVPLCGFYDMTNTPCGCYDG